MKEPSTNCHMRKQISKENKNAVRKMSKQKAKQNEKITLNIWYDMTALPYPDDWHCLLRMRYFEHL